MKKRWHLSYNAPVTLTFSIFCALVLLMDNLLMNHLIPVLFTAPGAPFDYHNPLTFLRLFTHVIGHADWNHLLGNLSFILLLGPLMEERYGAPMLCLMMAVTALVTGVINACLIPTSLLGASGIVFMLIVLASLSTIEKGEIPISFVFIIVIFMGREFLFSTKVTNVATFAHVAGGLCGSLFGFLIAPKKRAPKKSAEKPGADKPVPGTEKSPSASAANPVRSSVDALREKLRARQEKLHGERQSRRDEEPESSREQRPAMRTPYDAVPTKGPTDDETITIGTLEL